MHAVTRNTREASGPVSAAPAESADPNELGGLVMEQPKENATEISDIVPSPQQQDSLPPGQTSWLMHVYADDIALVTTRTVVMNSHDHTPTNGLPCSSCLAEHMLGKAGHFSTVYPVVDLFNGTICMRLDACSTTSHEYSSWSNDIPWHHEQEPSNM